VRQVNRTLLSDDAWVAALEAKAENMRTVEVKNNSYFQPSGVTAFWKALDDTAKWTYPDPAHHDSLGFAFGDSTILPVDEFTNNNVVLLALHGKGFVQSGNVMTDPGFSFSNFFRYLDRSYRRWCLVF